MARKQKQYHFIYKTVNQVNGKWYVGMHSTSNLEDGYIGSGKRLRYSIRKYGIENFKMEIQEFLPDRRSLKEREKEIVNEDLLHDSMCMNLKLGGEGGFMNEEHKQKCCSAGGKRNSQKLKTDFEHLKKFGEKISETKKQMFKDGTLNFKPLDWTGRSHKEETKIQIGKTNSLKQKGEGNSQFGTVWISKDGKSCKVKKENLEQFLKEGWTRGRKMVC